MSATFITANRSSTARIISALWTGKAQQQKKTLKAVALRWPCSTDHQVIVIPSAK